MNSLPECKYRRLTQTRVLRQLHCFLKRSNCTEEECMACLDAAAESGEFVEVRNEEGIVGHGFYYEQGDPKLRAAGSENWTVKQPSRGLGDTIAKMTHATGIAQAVHGVSRLLGVDCGCSGRQEWLNKAVPYRI